MMKPKCHTTTIIPHELSIIIINIFCERFKRFRVSGLGFGSRSRGLGAEED